MAITVLQEPQLFQPAYNENVFVVHSSSVNTYYRHKYICNVYDGLGVQVATLKTPAYPLSSSGQCYFNVGRIVENYVADYFLLASGSPALASGTAWNKYGVQFGEEYATTSGSAVAPIPTSAFTTLEYYNIWDACFAHPNMISYNQSTYLLNPSGHTGKWLTNMPRRTIGGTSYLYHECDLNEYGWLYAIENYGADIPIVYTFHRPGGNDTHTLTIASGTTMCRVPLTHKAACEYFGVAYTDTTYMTIYQTDGNVGGDNIPLTNTYVQIVDSCGRYDRQRIHFLNIPGGYDSFTFNMKSEKSADIERKSFQKKVGTLSGPSYSYSQYDRGSTVFDTLIKQKYFFNSDWITEAEMFWLAELISSPKALLQLGTLTPITINTNSFRYQKQQNGELLQVFFEAQVSIGSARQRA